MKKKILDNIYKKLTEAYKIQFIPLDDFEQQLAEKHDEFVTTIASYFQEYFKLMNSPNIEESSQIIKQSKEDYILERFNEDKAYYADKYKMEDLESLKSEQSFHFDLFSKRYDVDSTIPNNRYRIFLKDYISKNVIAKYPKIEWQGLYDDLIVENIFYRYFFSLVTDNNSLLQEDYLSIQDGDSIQKRAQEILKAFRDKYILNEYIALHYIANQNLDDIEFTGFETYIVNVGSRSAKEERFGWTTNNFHVINNGLDFGFTSSSKDEKPVKGHFIHIFILHPKHLEKISITIKEQEQTKYTIAKEIEKLSIKNECEVLISKHHGNETIIFDSREEARSFQNKILEIKEYRGANR
jgi:hypothetical protein